MTAGHLFPATKANTRYNYRNLHAQCLRCNWHLHGNLHAYIRNFIRKFGQKQYDELFLESSKSRTFSVEDLEAAYDVTKCLLLVKYKDESAKYFKGIGGKKL